LEGRTADDAELFARARRGDPAADAPTALITMEAVQTP
jgi:hypothetical protein